MTAIIAEQVRRMTETIAAQPPNEVMGVFALEQAGLAAMATPKGVIVVGGVLPDANLLDVHGAAISLREVLDGRVSVLVFYRGAWCPYCNIALRAYQAALAPELARRGVGLIAVSPQAPDGSLSMQEKNELSFTVVSDPANQLATAAGILTAPSEEVLTAQLQLGLDLTDVNADGSTTLPMPATVILDPDRTVRWVDVHPDYTTRSEPDQILAALDSVGHR